MIQQSNPPDSSFYSHEIVIDMPKLTLKQFHAFLNANDPDAFTATRYLQLGESLEYLGNRYGIAIESLWQIDTTPLLHCLLVAGRQYVDGVPFVIVSCGDIKKIVPHSSVPAGMVGKKVQIGSVSKAGNVFAKVLNRSPESKAGFVIIGNNALADVNKKVRYVEMND